MKQEKVESVINDLREEIKLAKDKGIRGRSICGAYHDFLRGKVLILQDLEIITLEDAVKMLADIEIACSGAWEEQV